MSLVGYLLSIYRIAGHSRPRRNVLAEKELKVRAYKKTQAGRCERSQLRAFVSETFVNRLLDWDQFVSGYLRRPFVVEKG